jgi:branched-chain amino acid transport system substrate-binding protein
MTGPQATYGEESWNGLLLAEEDVREAGAPIEFTMTLRDEKSTKQEAGNQAKALIETEQVHVLIGSVASSNTKQIFQEARESEVPCISPASTNDSLTLEGGPYTSRICFKDSFQGKVLANFALSQGWTRAAVVVDKAQDYSVGLADNFRTVFEAAGGTVSFDYYVTEDTDFSNVIQNVANQNPDVIFISGYYEQAGPMIKQAKEKWAGKPIIGGDGLDSPDLISLVGDTNAEIYLSSHFAADAPDEAVQAFAERYKSRFGKSPGAMAALGYDVLFVLMDAVRRAEDPTDPEQLAQAIRETAGVKGITGIIDLTTADRTPIKDAVIVRVDGGLRYHATVRADG